MPAIDADDDSVADGHAARCARDDLGGARGLGEFPIIGKRHAIDHQHPDSFRILHAGKAGIGHLPGRKRGAVPENEGFLLFRPLISEGHEALELFLVNHAEAVWLALF